MDNQLKFIIKTNGDHIQYISASVITELYDYNNLPHSKTIHITKGLKHLFSYAEETAKRKKIPFSKETVDLKDGKKTTITYDKGNLILSNYRRSCINRNKKIVKNALLGLSGLIVTGSTAKLLQNYQDYQDEPIEILDILDDDITDTIEDDILQEVKNNPKIPNIEIDEELSTSNTTSIETSEFSFEYQDRADDERVSNAKRHMEAFQTIGPRYGIDPNLLMAIMAQESAGIHHEYSQNGYAIGGMQIENFWHDKELTAYNFDIQEEETIIVNEEMLSDFWYNVKVASMILQNSLEYSNYDIPKAIQTYNYGVSNMEYLGDDWISNRDLINNGDFQYVEHVLSFLPNGTTLTMLKPNGSSCSSTISNTISNTHHL